MRSLPPRIIAAATAAVMIGALGACAPDSSGEEGDRSITIGVPFIGSLDPLAYAHRLFLPTQAVYESLIEWDESTGEFVPFLAEEFELSEDRQTLDLTLRTDVEFADGVHLDAAEVVGFLDIALASDAYMNTALWRDRYEAHVEATGEYTVRITTTKAIDQAFFTSLTFGPISSTAALDDHEALVNEPVGSGPYLVDEIVPEVSVSFVRNDDYRDPDAFAYDRVTFLTLADNVAALNALKTGQIDATVIDVSLAAEAEASGFTLHTGLGQFGSLVILDTAGEVIPALADVRVRRAMNLAFDREAILENLNNGFGLVSSQAFVPGQGSYVEGGDERYGFDLEEARELMEEAGYADGFDLVIPTSPGTVIYLAAYEPIVQQSLSEIGIRVTYESFAEPTAMFEALADPSYPVALTYEFYNNILLYFSEGNFASWAVRMATPEAAALVDVMDTGTRQEAAEAEAEMGELILDEAWFVPFSAPHTLWASAGDVDLVVGAISGYPRLASYRPAD